MRRTAVEYVSEDDFGNEGQMTSTIHAANRLDTKNRNAEDYIPKKGDSAEIVEKKRKMWNALINSKSRNGHSIFRKSGNTKDPTITVTNGEGKKRTLRVAKSADGKAREITTDRAEGDSGVKLTFVDEDGNPASITEADLETVLTTDIDTATGSEMSVFHEVMHNVIKLLAAQESGKGKELYSALAKAYPAFSKELEDVNEESLAEGFRMYFVSKLDTIAKEKDFIGRLFEKIEALLSKIRGVRAKADALSIDQDGTAMNALFNLALSGDFSAIPGMADAADVKAAEKALAEQRQKSIENLQKAVTEQKTRVEEAQKKLDEARKNAEEAQKKAEEAERKALESVKREKGKKAKKGKRDKSGEKAQIHLEKAIQNKLQAERELEAAKANVEHVVAVIEVLDKKITETEEAAQKADRIAEDLEKAAEYADKRLRGRKKQKGKDEVNRKRNSAKDAREEAQKRRYYAKRLKEDLARAEKNKEILDKIHTHTQNAVAAYTATVQRLGEATEAAYNARKAATEAQDNLYLAERDIQTEKDNLEFLEKTLEKISEKDKSDQQESKEEQGKENSDAAEDSTVDHEAAPPAPTGTTENAAPPSGEGGRAHVDVEGVSNYDRAEVQRQEAEVIARYTNPDGTKKPGWMCYEDGTPITTLSEEQFVYAQTHEFTEKFGDWQSLIIQKKLGETFAPTIEEGVFRVEQGGNTFKIAKELLKNAVTYHTRIGDVVIDGKSAKTSLNHGKPQKKLDVLVSIQKDFENAVYITSYKDFDDKDITNHYFAYPIVYGGERRLVFCRVREDVNMRRLYVHEVYIEDDLKNKEIAIWATIRKVLKTQVFLRSYFFVSECSLLFASIFLETPTQTLRNS